jgi:hypothetical protein
MRSWAAAVAVIVSNAASARRELRRWFTVLRPVAQVGAAATAGELTCRRKEVLPGLRAARPAMSFIGQERPAHQPCRAGWGWRTITEAGPSSGSKPQTGCGSVLQNEETLARGQRIGNRASLRRASSLTTLSMSAQSRAQTWASLSGARPFSPLFSARTSDSTVCCASSSARLTGT